MSADRRQFVQIALSAVGAVAAPFPARAAAWPARPVRTIVPLAAGTALDVVSRIALNEIAAQLGQPVLIENRPGAGGTIGGAIVAKADPDGYTLLADNTQHTITPAVYTNLAYDPVADLLPVCALATGPNVLIIAPSKAITTVAEFVALAKAKPGTLNFGSTGIGSTTHLAAERFRRSAGFEATHVPFRGGGFSTEVLAGRIDFAFSPIVSVFELIRSGQLVALAVNGRTRSTILPEVPTTLEAGFPNSDFTFWHGLFAPAKTPPEIIERLVRETRTALKQPNLAERLIKLGAEPADMTQAEFQALVAEDFKANGALVKAIGLGPG
jgi:tripartite-type tricarboxylate transporter receptor subunit TctC